MENVVEKAVIVRSSRSAFRAIFAQNVICKGEASLMRTSSLVGLLQRQPCYVKGLFKDPDNSFGIKCLAFATFFHFSLTQQPCVNILNKKNRKGKNYWDL